MKKLLGANIIILGIMVLSLVGCGKNGALEVVNIQDFDVNEYNQITLDYDEDDISVLIGNDDEIILKEYMTMDKKKYYARISKGNGNLDISEGSRPKFGDFRAKIELIIPENCEISVALHTTEANILSEEKIFVSSFKAETTRGKIELSDLSSNDICLVTTNGEITGKNLASETMDVKTTGGKINLEEISSSGKFNASGDGSITLFFKEVIGNLSVYAKNSDIDLTLPQNMSFYFSAKSKNGLIKSDFLENISEGEGSIEAEIGISPEIIVEVETKNGDIVVNGN